jgi:uncharacterized protein
MKPITQLILILLLTFTVVPVYGGDLEDGIDAYERNDYKAAKKIFIPLAERGDGVAQYYVGILTGSRKKWMTMSAGQGYAPAQFDLGFGYKYSDCKKARRWMQAAVDQNYPNALEEMGVWYQVGDCVPQNFKEALRLFQKGADIEHPPAQERLGRMYYLGEGVTQNYIIAHSWFIIAAVDGYDTAIYWREETRKLMTPSQIEKAQEMARNWKPKKSKGIIDQLKEKVGIK